MYFVFIHENRIKLAEIVLRREREDEGEGWRGESKIYCKHICKFQNVLYANKNKR
jgi:hypothetical protein